MELERSRLEESGVGADPLVSAIKAVVTQASRENLLPKIMWKADKQFGSKKLLEYQKSVHRKYDNDLKSPLKYDPEAAKSERQKFREKVVKLVNNQLEVDYFENVKLRDRTAVTYQGHQMEEEQVSTKKEFQIFKNFNEKRFKETYANLFDDQLEVAYPHLYHNRASKRCNTLHVLDPKPTTPVFLKTEQSEARVRIRPSQISFESPKTERKRILTDSKKKVKSQYNDKKPIGKQLPINERLAVERIMRQVGGFTHFLRDSSLCLTKESINRWLKGHYEKPARILDFLQLKQVVTFDEFWKVSKRLRVMPQDHLLFMAFLYFDGNNDGYICDYDLDRLSSLALKRPVLAHDFQKLKQCNIKKILSQRPPYLDLYKRSEITESIYFEWRIQQEGQGNSGVSFEIQMKNRLLSSRQKQVFLDFPTFCSVYRLEKPFLWYDLLHLFAGITHLGFNYN